MRPFTKLCEVCGQPYTYTLKAGKFCGKQCMNKYYNNKAYRLSLKLTDEQRNTILLMEQMFLDENKKALKN